MLDDFICYFKKIFNNLILTITLINITKLKYLFKCIQLFYFKFD